MYVVPLWYINVEYLIMLSRLLNFRTILATVAILIVIGTVFYSQYISKKIAADERRKIEQWVEAVKACLLYTSRCV